MINGEGRQLGSPQPITPNDTLHRDTLDHTTQGSGTYFETR